MGFTKIRDLEHGPQIVGFPLKKNKRAQEDALISENLIQGFRVLGPWFAGLWGCVGPDVALGTCVLRAVLRDLIPVGTSFHQRTCNLGVALRRRAHESSLAEHILQVPVGTCSQQQT